MGMAETSEKAPLSGSVDSSWCSSAVPLHCQTMWAPLPCSRRQMPMTCPSSTWRRALRSAPSISSAGRSGPRRAQPQAGQVALRQGLQRQAPRPVQGVHAHGLALVLGLRETLEVEELAPLRQGRERVADARERRAVEALVANRLDLVDEAAHGRIERRIAAHSGWILLSRMTWPHFWKSLRTTASSASGGPPPGSRPSAT